MSHQPIEESIDAQRVAPQEAVGQRLDRWAATQFSDYSRNRLQQWIADGSLLVDGKVQSANFKLKGGEVVHLRAAWEPAGAWRGESGIALDLLYEDEDVLIINKQAGLVTHPGAGHREGTLANALLGRYPKLARVTRAGIVHRLDKETSGVMMVAHSELAYQRLVQALRQRQVSRRYVAVLVGRLHGEVCVDEPIGRHPRHRTRMSVATNGLRAVTYLKPLECFNAATLAEVRLETGRTHQIRVHAEHINHPVLGDSTYKSRRVRRSDRAQPLTFPRQALHAEILALTHPCTEESLEFRAPWPADLADLVRTLRADSLTIQGSS